MITSCLSGQRGASEDPLFTFTEQGIPTNLRIVMMAFTFGVEKPKEHLLRILPTYGYDQDKSADPGRGRRENRAAVRTALAHSLSLNGVKTTTMDEADVAYDSLSVVGDGSISEVGPEGTWSGFCESIRLSLDNSIH